MTQNEINKPDTQTSTRKFHTEIEKIANEKFKIDMQCFTYFVNDDVPDP